MNENYSFTEIEIEIDGRVYMCSGELSFEYEPGEPDEPMGYWGATPGHGPSATDIEIICLDEASWCDDEDNEFDASGELHIAETIKDHIVEHFMDNQDVLTEHYERI